MYQLMFRQVFEARHALVGADWGQENHPHSHNYVWEVILEGPTLDSHGFLVDLVDLEAKAGALVHRYRGAFLNDLPEFHGLNPSLEHFVRILTTSLAQTLEAPRLTAFSGRLWEHQNAWAAYRLP